MYVVNNSAFPFVAAILCDELTHEDLATIGEVNVVHRERGRHVSLIDGRRAKLPGPPMRRAIGEMMKSLEGKNEGVVVCSCVLVGSAAAVGVLTALQWLAPRKQPLKYFQSAVDAYAWMRARAAEAALVLPDAAGAIVKRLDDMHESGADARTFAAK